MTQIAKKNGFTLIELIVAVVLATFIMGYAWRVYFSGRETMRNTVTQSQLQSDTRIFLDHLDNQMASCYSFFELSPDEHKFGFYSFVFSRMPLDEIIYDHSGKLKKTGKTSTQKIKVVRYEYAWVDNKVTLSRSPGWLNFLQKPMKFEDGKKSDFLSMYNKTVKVVLRDVNNFEFKGYNQIPDRTQNSGFKIEEIKKETATNTVFITLRIHTKKDEGKKRRSEELDIVTKFYSKVRLNAVNNPGYFCSTDQDGKF